MLIRCVFDIHQMRLWCFSDASLMLFRCIFDAPQMRVQCSSDVCSCSMLFRCVFNALQMRVGVKCSSNARSMLFRCVLLLNALQMRVRCSSDECSMPWMLNQCSLNAQTMSFQCKFKQCSSNAQIMSIQSEFDAQWMLSKCSSMPKIFWKVVKKRTQIPQNQSPYHNKAFKQRKKTFRGTSRGSRFPDAQKSQSRIPSGSICSQNLIWISSSSDWEISELMWG